jgi:hypothetical protein
VGHDISAMLRSPGGRAMGAPYRRYVRVSLSDQECWSFLYAPTLSLPNRLEDPEREGGVKHGGRKARTSKTI